METPDPARANFRKGDIRTISPRVGGPQPVIDEDKLDEDKLDEDKLDLHQGFVEFEVRPETGEVTQPSTWLGQACQPARPHLRKGNRPAQVPVLKP